MAFQESWLQAVPGSVAARVARAQTRLVGSRNAAGALADLQAAGRLPGDDPYLWVLGNRVFQSACQSRDRAAAREAIEFLGQRVSPGLQTYRAWASGEGAEAGGASR